MKKSSTPVKVAGGIGAGLAAVGAAAAMYYFYGSDKAKQHRKSAAKWAVKMKSQVVKESKRLQNITPEAIATIVDSVAKTYRDVKNIDTQELKKASDELKSNWKKVKDEAAQSKAQMRRTARKGARKAVRKTA